MPIDFEMYFIYEGSELYDGAMHRYYLFHTECTDATIGPLTFWSWDFSSTFDETYSFIFRWHLRKVHNDAIQFKRIVETPWGTARMMNKIDRARQNRRPILPFPGTEDDGVEALYRQLSDNLTATLHENSGRVLGVQYFIYCLWKYFTVPSSRERRRYERLATLMASEAFQEQVTWPPMTLLRAGHPDIPINVMGGSN